MPDERAVLDLGRRIAASGHGAKASVFRMSWWSDKLLAWAMSRPGFKTQLFRFVDVFPACDSDDDIRRHLEEYFDGVDVPKPIDFGLDVADHVPFGARVTAAVARRNILRMARNFIAGASPQEALPRLRRMWDAGEASTVDLLGEKVVTSAESDRYAGRVLEMVDALVAGSKAWPSSERLERDPWGVVPRVNVSVKPSALSPLLAPLTANAGIDDAFARIRPVLERARDAGATVHFDTEHYDVKDLCFALARRAGEAFPHGPQLGVVVQAYLRDSYDDLRALIEWSASTLRVPLQIRLVKGAYWDAETVTGRAEGWPVPVWQRKAETDANYERCATLLLDSAGSVRPAFGSHNIRTIAYVIASARERGLADDAYEIQLLYGMAEPIHAAVRSLGLRVRAYAPVGDLVPGMSYLVRRLLENTSNESFLRHHFAEGQTLDRLLAAPEADLSAPVEPAGFGGFANEPHSEWRRPAPRSAMSQAVRSFAGDFEAPVLIAGAAVPTGDRIVSVNPSRFNEVVCRSGSATPSQADHALDVAASSLRSWSGVGAAARAAVLRRAASIMRSRRFELAALEVFEAGKPWPEADADVAEAIDFCEYYALQAERLDHVAIEQAPGESNAYRYRPRGVGVVIAPWNFPIAIPCGMTTAALAMGNAVVLKPAEQTPGCALRLVQILHEAGVPSGVLAFLPGIGEDVGAYLVSHPQVAFVAFTGSKAVGLHILSSAARVSPGQRHVRHVVAEMGGKNSIVVDTDADLDQAVPAIVKSAFGYAGQKCSAASRVIAAGHIHDELCERLSGATRLVPCGPAADMATMCGPLIDQDALERVRSYQALAASEGEVLVQREPYSDDGYFAGPCVVALGSPTGRIATEEIFGPVLAVMRADSFETAVAMASDSDYALTGGVFSRSPANIAYAAQEFRAGNLYINRATTGALVGRQPFGGYGLSGAGTKAGGPDYLLQFADPVVVTENTLRQGFVP